MGDLIERLTAIVGAEAIVHGDAISEDLAHDEALTATPHRPDVVVRPAHSTQVSAVMRLAAELGVPVTARGSGTGLSGACIPRHGGILVSFEHMAEILEIDLETTSPSCSPASPSTSSMPPPRSTASLPGVPGRDAPASAATWPPTQAACGRSSTA